VADSGFEFKDFKITFHISVLAYLNRIRAIQAAEESLGLKFKFGTYLPRVSSTRQITIFRAQLISKRYTNGSHLER